jgi:hypothetical protein
MATKSIAGNRGLRRKPAEGQRGGQSSSQRWVGLGPKEEGRAANLHIPPAMWKACEWGRNSPQH